MHTPPQIAQSQLGAVFSPGPAESAHKVRPLEDPPELGHPRAQVFGKALVGAHHHVFVLGGFDGAAGKAPGIQQNGLPRPLQKDRRAPFAQGGHHLIQLPLGLRLLHGEYLLHDHPGQLPFGQGAGQHGPFQDKIVDGFPIGHAVYKHGQGGHLSAEQKGTENKIRVLFSQTGGLYGPAVFPQRAEHGAQAFFGRSLPAEGAGAEEPGRSLFRFQQFKIRIGPVKAQQGKKIFFHPP